MSRILAAFFCLILFRLGAQDIYDPRKLNEVKIIFETDNWDAVLHSLKEEDEGDRILATLYVNGQRLDSVGVRYKGNSSYHSVRNHEGTKLPFNIDLDHRIETNQLSGGYKKLKLSNIFRDPSYVREVLSYEIARKYTHAPRAGFAKVTVNDTYLGIYNMVESIDKNYVKRHFNATDNALIKCDPLSYAAVERAKTDKRCKNPQYSSLVYMGKDTVCYRPFYELKTKVDSNYGAFLNMIDVLNNKPDQLESVLDIDQTLWMHAFNAVLVNLDSYVGRLSHNYYMYQKDGGQFMPLIWDLNLSFGGFRYLDEGQPLTSEDMKNLSIFANYENPNRPLLSKVLSTPLYRKMYVAHVKTILEENFYNNWYKTRGKEIRSYLDYAVRNEKNSLYDYESFKTNFESSSKAKKSIMIGLVELMDARVAYLKEHPLLNKPTPRVERPQVVRQNDSLTVQVRVSDAEAVYIFYEWEGEQRHREKMTLEEGGLYRFSLPKKDKKGYYFLVAEGKKTAFVYPEHGSKNMLTLNY